jgi:hypothetical protein
MAGTIRTNAAAAMLGVSTNTLRSWERRFGFPQPRRTTGAPRPCALDAIEAPRAALEETHNISSAIAMARERGAGPASPARLRSALLRLDEAEADRVLEEALVVRSLERAVTEVLLAGVEDVLERCGPGAPEHGFAWRYATRWLSAAMRLAPAATRPDAVVLFDAAEQGDLDALYVQVLEVFLRRAGLRTLTLGADLDTARVGRALAAVEPSVVVLAGRRASLDVLGRLVFAARRVGGDRVHVLDFRGAVPETGASTVTRLDVDPLAARHSLLALLEARPVAQRAAV